MFLLSSLDDISLSFTKKKLPIAWMTYYILVWFYNSFWFPLTFSLDHNHFSNSVENFFNNVSCVFFNIFTLYTFSLSFYLNWEKRERKKTHNVDDISHSIRAPSFLFFPMLLFVPRKFFENIKVIVFKNFSAYSFPHQLNDFFGLLCRTLRGFQELFHAVGIAVSQRCGLVDFNRVPNLLRTQIAEIVVEFDDVCKESF